MSNEVQLDVSDFVSINANDPLSKALKFFKERTRDLLVFDDRDVFIGYVTKRSITLQSRINPEAKISNFIRRIPTISKDVAIDEIARLLLSASIFSVPVEENGKVIGVFRDIDVLRASSDIFGAKKVKEVMTQNPITITPDTTAARLIAILRTNNISRTPVVNETNSLVGIVSPHDMSKILTKVFSRKTKGDRKTTKHDALSVTVKEIMTEDVVTCNQNDFLIEAIDKLYSKNHKALIVVNKENNPIGIITTRDLLESVSTPPETEGYYLRVLGDVDDADMEQVMEMGIDFIKKYASIIGNSGQFYVHSKVIPKKKFRGFSLCQIRLRITTNKGNVYVVRSEGYGIFSAYAVGLDKLEREIVSERELEIQQKHTAASERYLLEEFEEL
ncbi:MAG: CBS domain-containing protein [Candidatus Heimdallarchaeota archaeon]